MFFMCYNNLSGKFCFDVFLVCYMGGDVVNSGNKVFSENDVNEYLNRIIEEIRILNGSEDDIRFVSNEVVLNGLRSGRDPKDVAWAILQ